MYYTDIIERLAQAGTDKWAVHAEARSMIAAGQDVIEMAIGEPDVAPPEALVDSTISALRSGRTGYAPSTGVPGLRDALATRYTRTTGRRIDAEQIMCFPGTQTALYVVLRAIVGPGDHVLVGDPMYATYEPVIASCGGTVRPVVLRPENGFRIDVADLEANITPRTRAILLNTPHNPTGATLTAADVEAISRLALEHDLWLVSDEVYEELIFAGTSFYSPLARLEVADRVVVVNSISKSHAAPGLRSGWCVGPAEFCEQIRPLSEAVLFGNQPFIADATAEAVTRSSPVATGMAQRFAARAKRLAELVHTETGLRVHLPEAGMFALIDVASTGMDGKTYAYDLLRNGGVGVLPGASFGASLDGWVRVALTRPDEQFDLGCQRIVAHALARG